MNVPPNPLNRPLPVLGPELTAAKSGKIHEFTPNSSFTLGTPHLPFSCYFKKGKFMHCPLNFNSSPLGVASLHGTWPNVQESRGTQLQPRTVHFPGIITIGGFRANLARQL